MEKCEKCLLSTACEHCKEEESKQQQQMQRMERLHEEWTSQDREKQKRAMEQGEEYNIVVRYPVAHKEIETTPEQREKQDIERRKRALVEQQHGDEPWQQQ